MIDPQALGNPLDALPDNIRQVVEAYLRGEIKQYLLIAEHTDGQVSDSWEIVEPDANRYLMVGCLEVVKRDYMRLQVNSREEYVVAPKDDDE